MASVDIIIKEGDTRDWSITLSDTDNTRLNLTNARVYFNLKTREDRSTAFFTRDTAGTGSDNISIATPATSGIVTITPTSADWSQISDYGIYVGEFKVKDAQSDWMYVKDILVNIQRPVIA